MSTAEDDLYSPAKDYAQPQIQLGTVGWAGRDDVADLGTVDNDGLTFVRVTLYAGKTPGERVQKGVAQGHEILCVLADGVFRVPKKGARCYVAVPAGMEQVAGAGVIIATVSAGPERAANVGEGDTTVSATGGGQARAIVKANGTITLFTTNDNQQTGKAVVFELSPSKLAFSSPWGSFVFDASGFHLKTKAGPRIDMGGVAIPGIPSDLTAPLTSYITLTAPTIKVKGALVKLGIGPTYGTALQAPSSGLTVPGTPITTGTTYQSSSVWVSAP